MEICSASTIAHLCSVVASHLPTWLVLQRCSGGEFVAGSKFHARKNHVVTEKTISTQRGERCM